MALDANGDTIETWHIVDSNNMIAKDGDTISFTYLTNPVTATLTFNNGVMGVNCANNDPFSCLLSELRNNIDEDFTITP